MRWLEREETVRWRKRWAEGSGCQVRDVDTGLTLLSGLQGDPDDCPEQFSRPAGEAWASAVKCVSAPVLRSADLFLYVVGEPGVAG